MQNPSFFGANMYDFHKFLYLIGFPLQKIAKIC